MFHDVRLPMRWQIAWRIGLGYIQRWLHRTGRLPSLTGRLLAMLFLGMLVIFLIASTGLWWASTRLLDDSLRKQATQWIAELDELAIPHYASSRLQHLPVIDQRLKHFPEILFVRYYDSQGQTTISEYGRPPPEEAPVLSEEQMQVARKPSDADTLYPMTRETTGSGPPYLRIIAPVWIRSIAKEGVFGFRFGDEGRERVRVIGYIDLGINAAYYHQELNRSLLRGSGLVAIMLLLALAGGRLLVHRWLAPLAGLRVPLERLAQGDTSVEMENNGRYAEIAAISEAVLQLQRMAERDPLTGLLNRTRFERILETELVRLSEGATKSALYFIDLDQFKYVNDTLGHAVGDRLLIQVAHALRRRLRDSDVISRFGGDEFTVLAHDVTASEATDIANTITHLVHNEGLVDGDRIFNSSCSIGITMIGGARYTVAELFAQADIACYAAKSRGRNTFQFYEPSDEERQRMSADFTQSQYIKDALRDNGFQLYYQPMVGLKRPKEVYYEVLLRIGNGQLGPILPSVFLPAAERFGLLADIDRWVVERALHSLMQFRRNGCDIGFSINLSGQSFEEHSLVSFIQDQLSFNGLAGKEVIFEITEQTAVRHMDHGRRVIQSLMDAGCHIALDDFGVGFSSFSYLKNLPADFVKIDGTFVQHMADDVIDQAMVRSINDVAHTLGKRTVAESVQDQKTVNLLRKSGVDFVQGNYIGRPSERITRLRRRAVG